MCDHGSTVGFCRQLVNAMMQNQKAVYIYSISKCNKADEYQDKDNSPLEKVALEKLTWPRACKSWRAWNHESAYQTNALQI